MVHYHFDFLLCSGDETRKYISLFIYRSRSLITSGTALRTLMYLYLFIAFFICLLTEELVLWLVFYLCILR
jgi:hypothetical protein